MLDEAINISFETNENIAAVVDLNGGTVPTDDELVRAVISGDQSAFAEIFDRYKRHVTRTVGRFFRERSDIEECVQIAFTKLYISLDKFRGAADNSFAAWVTRIAVNVCYDEFRRRQRKAESFFSDMSADETDILETMVDARGTSVESTVASVQLARKILSSLNAEDRVALTLVYSEDLSIEEAASAIGVTPSSLKSRLFRCRNQLKARFGYLFK